MLIAVQRVQAERPPMQQSATGEGIGAAVPRLEDDRYLRGRG